MTLIIFIFNITCGKSSINCEINPAKKATSQAARHDHLKKWIWKDIGRKAPIHHNKFVVRCILPMWSLFREEESVLTCLVHISCLSDDWWVARSQIGRRTSDRPVQTPHAWFYPWSRAQALMIYISPYPGDMLRSYVNHISILLCGKGATPHPPAGFA